MEKRAIQVLRNTILHFYPDCFFKKIPDAGFTLSGENRFTPKRGIDIFVVWNGKILAIEAKYTKDRFRFESVSKDQIRELYQLAINGAFSYVVVNFYYPKRYDAFYFIGIFDFLYLAEKHPRKSIRMESLDRSSLVTFSSDRVKDNLIIDFDKAYLI